MAFDDELINYIKVHQQHSDDILKNIKNFNHLEEYWKIKKHLDNFLNNENVDNRFIIMSGLRCVGKTTILLQLYDYLLNEKNIKFRNILYLNMDEIVKKYSKDLLEVVETFISSFHNSHLISLKEKIFIFFDEVHFDKEWGISGKIIFDKAKNIFLICTGSSAINLEISGMLQEEHIMNHYIQIILRIMYC